LSTFIPGIELSRLFFQEAVRTVLSREYPGLQYAAALLGAGSEVLGFDDEMSTDHCWGPRIDLLLPDEASPERKLRIAAMLHDALPDEFRGYPTRFTPPGTPDGDSPAPNLGTRVVTRAEFFRGYLGYDITQSIDLADWLTFSSHKLKTIAAGPIFHDEIGLTEVRGRFAWYPHDVWLNPLASGWNRISQEEHLMGRAGHVGDEVGSALIGARLVRDVMRLGFLMEREFAPYPKWFGSAFQRLQCSAALSPHLRAALAANDWGERERALVAAYEILAELHNRLAITPPLPTAAQPFFSRPFAVMAIAGFAERITEQIKDRSVRSLLSRPLIGSIDQLSDSTDLVEWTVWRERLRELYR
jgi:hypothetical protein